MEDSNSFVNYLRLPDVNNDELKLESPTPTKLQALSSIIIPVPRQSTFRLNKRAIINEPSNLEQDKTNKLLLTLIQREIRSFSEVKEYLESNLPYISIFEYFGMIYDILSLGINVSFIFYNFISIFVAVNGQNAVELS